MILVFIIRDNGRLIHVPGLLISLWGTANQIWKMCILSLSDVGDALGDLIQSGNCSCWDIYNVKKIINYFKSSFNRCSRIKCSFKDNLFAITWNFVMDNCSEWLFTIYFKDFLASFLSKRHSKICKCVVSCHCIGFLNGYTPRYLYLLKIVLIIWGENSFYERLSN